MKPGGIILAAGESKRMGCDKALLQYRESTFLNHILSGFLRRLHPVVVVLGYHVDIIRESISLGARSETLSAMARIVVNSHYHRGMLSSLQVGIAALPNCTEAAMFTLVDHPDVQESTLDSLLATYSETSAPLVIPKNGTCHGHPVVAARNVLNEIARLPSEASPKDVIRRHLKDTVFVDVDDMGILRDIDTPAEYERLIEPSTKKIFHPNKKC